MNTSILYSEINCVCILMLLLLSFKVRRSMFLQSQRALLYLVIMSNIIFFLLDAVWIFFNNNVIDITITLNWILNILYYILSGVLGLLWFIYSETILESKFVRQKKYLFLSLIPIILLIILSLLSIKTGIMFYIDENNIYHRGPAYVLQLICSYGYVLFTALKSFILSFKTNDYIKKVEMRTLSIFVIPTMIAGITQVFFPGYPILCIGNTFGILYIYVTRQEQLVSVDPLTKLNNRNRLYQYLSTKLNHFDNNSSLYLLIMDIDYFKTINDRYGHIEGDEALKKVGNALMRVCYGKNYFVCRYGGDEFIMICSLNNDENINSVCNAIHNEIKNSNTPYDLSISIGYVKFTNKIKNQTDFISLADKELYKIKKNRSK